MLSDKLLIGLCFDFFVIFLFVVSFSRLNWLSVNFLAKAEHIEILNLVG